jgi:hypothetical protein
VWYISLSDGGVPFTIEDGVLAKIEIKRPMGTFIEAFCAIEKNTTIKYDFSQDAITKNTAVVEGVHDCSVVLYDAEGNKIGSPRFTMVVRARVINSDDINLSDEDKSAVEAMIIAEAAREQAETGRVNAEATRVLAESERKLNETARNLAVKEAIKKLDTLDIPEVSEADEGKILQVKGGKWDAVEIAYVEDGEF